MGLVHHSNYLRYFEIARTELLRSSGGNYKEFEESGLYVVVVRVDCRYRLPAKYDDLLEVTVEIERITEARIEHAYRIRCEDRDLITAKVTLAVIDRAGRLQRVPDYLRNPTTSNTLDRLGEMQS